ncbi:MAG: reverse transcriptase domain-containing protein [Solirubrobacteraceae bacterium]
MYIAKPDGRQRPLGIAALEDKILQRALVEVLNAIYETDFLGFSYGFRQGRSPHHALDALAAGIVGKKVNWVLDLDFQDYFSSLDHQWLERFLEHRIADRRVLRLIQKWMAAGVIENGSRTAFDEGVPQGSLCAAAHNPGLLIRLAALAAAFQHRAGRARLGARPAWSPVRSLRRRR